VAFDLFPIPANVGLLVSGWFLYSIFTLSLCLIIAPLSEMSEVLEKFIPVVTYIMIPFSGLFTMSSWLSPTLREYLIWSPFVNAMEMMRYGLWGERVDPYYDVMNPIYCSMVAAVIGLMLCRRIRKKITVE